MPNPLGDDAAALIKEAQEYLILGPIRWSKPQAQHVMSLDGGIELPVTHLAAFYAKRREEIIVKIIRHLFEEVGQAQYSGGHGSRTTYTRGCRGLLCRRANREELRNKLDQSASARFALPDELLDAAEARILPEEIVGHIRYADKVAVS